VGIIILESVLEMNEKLYLRLKMNYMSGVVSHVFWPFQYTKYFMLRFFGKFVWYILMIFLFITKSKNN
jgi:hypothetical protein